MNVRWLFEQTCAELEELRGELGLNEGSRRSGHRAARRRKWTLLSRDC